jgi:hypothetical protein
LQLHAQDPIPDPRAALYRWSPQKLNDPVAVDLNNIVNVSQVVNQLFGWPFPTALQTIRLVIEVARYLRLEVAIMFMDLATPKRNALIASLLLINTINRQLLQLLLHSIIPDLSKPVATDRTPHRIAGHPVNTLLSKRMSRLALNHGRGEIIETDLAHKAIIEVLTCLWAFSDGACARAR